MYLYILSIFGIYLLGFVILYIIVDIFVRICDKFQGEVLQDEIGNDF
jgi:hypothetical protein